MVVAALVGETCIVSVPAIGPRRQLRNRGDLNYPAGLGGEPNEVRSGRRGYPLFFEVRGPFNAQGEKEYTATVQRPLRPPAGGSAERRRGVGENGRSANHPEFGAKSRPSRRQFGKFLCWGSTPVGPYFFFVLFHAFREKSGEHHNII